MFSKFVSSLFPSSTTSSSLPDLKPIQTKTSQTVHAYTHDLTPAEKANLTTAFSNDNTLAIAFRQAPLLSFTIRRQDIFESQAEVIVNAANSHLGGGGGIDGAIHRKGRVEYANAHRALKTQYKSKYVLGHAAMIASGQLKRDHKIDHVIVVAGPQDESTPSKESELYSCYYNSLELAHSQNKKSIAFPSISTGIFGFPKERAAAISLKAAFDFMNLHPHTTLRTISIHFLPTDSRSVLEMYQAAAAV